MEGVNTELLAAGSDVLGSKHGSVGGGLVAVGLDLHTTGDPADGFAAGQIGDVHERVVERGVDTGNSEDELVTCIIIIREEVLFFILFLFSSLLSFWESAITTPGRIWI